ncbi:hemolysin type calcium-binding protein [Palleronia aestuarii]|uniref:Hemolysin type calcium-binding protein n=1 Tax=Palleronia aestuarii TaxID=568105 RepID=A0A2W7NMF7_9RHOB|nr:Calx-beta domain-containing protein [Palleronia aestuarii]PZX14346.1 hemolysin type calcium-binding protein [Palleronia aestuarii]
MAIVNITGGSSAEGDGRYDAYPAVSVNLDAPATAPVTIGYRLLSGTAQVGDDFDYYGGRQVTFQAGEQSKTIQLRTENESVAEPDEAFVFEAFVISGNANFPGDAPVGRATVFILDDDGTVVPNAIFVSSPVLVENDSGTQTANFEVSLSRPATNSFSIPWTTQSGSATAGEDFRAADGTLSFVAGQTKATIGVQIFGDEKVEPNEQFGIRFATPSGFAESALGVATIIDDDTAPNGPSVSTAGATLTENDGSYDNYADLAVNLSSPAAATTQVGYRLVSGTAQVGTDVDYYGARSVTFQPGEQSETVRIRTDNDTSVESDEFFLFEAFIENSETTTARIPGGNVVDQSIVWILDDDGLGQPAIGITSPTVVEGDSGTSDVAVKMSLSRPATESFQIAYRTVGNGSAVAGRDFVAQSGTINVAPGQQDFSFNVEIIGDRNVESEESFLLSLSPSIFYDGATVSTITIVDGDVAQPTPGPGNDSVDYSDYTTSQTIRGLGGNDRIIGGLVRDFLNGDDGNDIINGGNGSDIIRGNSGFDRLFGGNGNDVVRGDAGNDTISGNSGADILYGDDGYDQMFGGDGNDVLRGGSQADLMLGEGGADELVGGAGNDRLEGGSGNDLLSGEIGNDALFGGSGNDRLFGGLGFDRLDGGGGADVLRGGEQADNLFGRSGNDVLDGGEGNDRLFAGSDNDEMTGGAGADALFGEAGNDTLIGNDGSDRIFAGSGFDRIVGGAGDDVLAGNFNADRFVFQNGFGRDRILDFEARNSFEKIDLSDVSSIGGLGDLRANHLSQQGADAIIDALGGNTITLVNVSIGDLDQTDFVF